MTDIEFWNLIVSSTSTLLAAIAILLYIILWFRDKTSSSYDIFDSTYLEILKIGIEYPDFRNVEYTRRYAELPTAERFRYETYAFICWNFCETIFDKGDKDLMKTWSVVITNENSLHRVWFNNPDNHPKFKEEFRYYINNQYAGV